MDEFGYPELTASLEELGRIVRAKRRETGWRIDEAAALCGVSVDLLSRLENGKSGVGSGRLLRVLDRLGLAVQIVDRESTRQALIVDGGRRMLPRARLP